MSGNNAAFPLRIRAAVAESPSAPLSVKELRLDEPRANEVLVEVSAVGICHTDIAVRNQWMPLPLPMVLGHEGAGIVRAIGRDVTTVACGDRVVMSYWHCGECHYCESGHPAYCIDHSKWTTGGGRPDGSNALHGEQETVHGFFFAQSSFATHAIATERNVVKVDADVDLVVAAPMACGFQTGAGTVISRLAPPAGASIAVFGAGAVGMAAVLAARTVGCTTVVAVDVHASRLQLARELGATHTIDASRVTDVAQALRSIEPRGLDFSVETSALPAVAKQAIDCLAPRGTAAILGVGPQGTALSIDMTQLLSSGRTITGVTMGDTRPAEFIPMLLNLHQQGRFPVDRLISTYSLNEINQAIHDVESGGVIKAVLVPD